MRRLFLALAIAVTAIAISPPGALADGPLALKRNAVLKGRIHFGKVHSSLRFVLRSPGKGIVGTARARCNNEIHEFERPDHTQRCSLKTRFSEGKVVARGLYTERDRIGRMPIVGGTRTFRHARGKIVFTPNGRNKTTLVYKLESFG